jgi:integrase/recombinase XerD
MLITFRRHKIGCKNRSRRERNCKCPIYVEGTLNHAPIRKALETRDWNSAQAIIHRWERQGYAGAENEPENRVKVGDAITRYLEDCKARHLADLTLKKYRGFLIGNPDQRMTRKDIEPTPTLLAWCGSQSLSHLDQLGIDQLRSYRAAWKDSLMTAIKRLQGLKAFWQFCSDTGWTSMTTIKALKPPKERLSQKHPFEPEEMQAILEAADQRPRAKQLRALILLLRYSGLRIKDAVTCACSRLDGDRLFLYTQKSGTPVWIVLPPVAVDALRECPRPIESHWFSYGVAKGDTDAGHWSRRLQAVFRLAGIKNGHAHRFRHTLAVTQLKQGTPIVEVAAMLGNTARIVEKHYASWISARQEALEARMRESYRNDPLASAPSRKVIKIG